MARRAGGQPVITVLGVPLAPEAEPVLAEARTVIATAEELRAVHGRVPFGAVVDVLGPRALEVDGHRWNEVQDSEHVVVLVPAGPALTRVVRELEQHFGGQVIAVPPL